MEEKIIDGVDVAGCRRRIGKNNYCRYFKRPCADNNFNCIWKQKARLEQENEELKRKYEENKTVILQLQQWQDEDLRQIAELKQKYEKMVEISKENLIKYEDLRIDNHRSRRIIMQDRFRYRVWDKTKNKWLYFDFSTYPTYQERIWQALTDGETFYQCTGLKDKNGTLIYEGDIIKFTSVYKCSLFENIKEIIFEVDFDNLKYCLNQIKILKGNYSYPYMLDFGEIFKVGDYDYNQTKIKLEVIGNIYENAELLEE